MVFFLVFNELRDCWYLVISEGKRPITFLPGEFRRDKVVVVDPVSGISFDVLHQVRQRLKRVYPEEEVDMVLRSVDDKEFVAFFVNNALDVFVEIGFECWEDEGL